MRVARATLQRGASGVLVRQKPPENWSAPPSSPGRRHLEGTANRPMLLTSVRYLCNGFSCLNGASR